MKQCSSFEKTYLKILKSSQHFPYENKQHYQEMLTGAEGVDLLVGTVYVSLLFLKLAAVGILGIYNAKFCLMFINWRRVRFNQVYLRKYVRMLSLKSFMIYNKCK